MRYESSELGDSVESPQTQTGPPLVRPSTDINQLMTAIERNLLFRIQWPDLLSAGPRSLVHMGDCYMAVYETSNLSLVLFDHPRSVLELP